jgi:uncharacterized protein YegP (UPF0339 family)
MSGDRTGVTGAGAQCQISRSANGDYHWRMKAQNGRVVAVAAHGHARLSTCRAAFEDLRRRAADLNCVMLHAPEHGNGWFWSARDSDGRAVARSDRAYERYSTCQAAYERFAALLAGPNEQHTD